MLSVIATTDSKVTMTGSPAAANSSATSTDPSIAGGPRPAPRVLSAVLPEPAAAGAPEPVASQVSLLAEQPARLAAATSQATPFATTSGGVTPQSSGKPADPLAIRTTAAPEASGMAAALFGPATAASTSSAASIGAIATDPDAADPADQIAPALIQLARRPGGETMTVELHPATLGRVDVRVDRTADGQVHVTVASSRSETLSVLAQSRPQIEAALQRAGISADQRTLSFQSSLVAPTTTGAQPGAQPGVQLGATMGLAGGLAGRSDAAAADLGATFAAAASGHAGDDPSRHAAASPGGQGFGTPAQDSPAQSGGGHSANHAMGQGFAGNGDPDGTRSGGRSLPAAVGRAVAAAAVVPSTAVRAASAGLDITA